MWGRPQAHVRSQVPKAELAALLPPRPVIVEAGAHRGVDTVEFARGWPEGKIYAFEPVPELFRAVEKLTAGYPNVSCVPLALGAKEGFQTFHVSSGASDGSGSLLSPERHRDFHPEVEFGEQISVPTVTLDAWAAAARVPQVDLLWLDLQGSEPAVLASAPRVLRTVRVVHTEVSLVPTYSGVMLYPEFRRWMEDQGFIVAEELLPYPDMGNVLFVRHP